MIFCGLVGATIAGLLIDYTKRFKEITVITLSFAILCLIWFMEVRYEWQCTSQGIIVLGPKCNDCVYNLV